MNSNENSQNLEENDSVTETVENSPELISEEKISWQHLTGLSEETLSGAMEAIIFMSDRPVPLMKLKGLLHEDIPLRVLHQGLSRLQDEYEASHHGIRLVEVAEGLQFRTKQTFAPYIKNIFKVSSTVLSPVAMEVLALIAYRQPLSRTEIEKTRGVDSTHIIRGLLDKRLITSSGRSEELGRPVLYSTTLEFLEVFNLKNLEELPPEHELENLVSGQGVGNISDIKNLFDVAGNEKFNKDDLAELDQLHDNILSIATETSFTKLLKMEDLKKGPENREDSKSAFDLLEEYLTLEEIIVQNKESLASMPCDQFFDREGEEIEISETLPEMHEMAKKLDLDLDFLEEV